MGIGVSMGISPGMVAGAVICGAYFGDKMSPLSDTTNLASGLSGVELFEHIKHMFYTTIPAVIIALIAFFFIGMQYGNKNFYTKSLDEFFGILKVIFLIPHWLWLVLLVVMVWVPFKSQRYQPFASVLYLVFLLKFLCKVEQ